MHFLVAEFGFAENFRFQLKLHELFHSLALHENFWALLVNRDAQLIFLREKNRVLLRRKFETQLIEQCAKLHRLF